MSTNYTNWGIVELTNEVTKEQENEIIKIFGYDPERKYRFTPICTKENYINFEEVYGDIEADLDKMAKYCSESGNPVKDVSISYYGSYDGAYRWANGKIVQISIEDIGMFDATAEDLLKEACGKEGGAFIYRVLAEIEDEGISLCVANAVSEKSAKELAARWISEYDPDDNADPLDPDSSVSAFTFWLYKEKLESIGSEENFRPTVIEIALEDIVKEK